jgi:hypothetical protein
MTASPGPFDILFGGTLRLRALGVKWGNACCNVPTTSRIDINSRLGYHFGQW